MAPARSSPNRATVAMLARPRTENPSARTSELALIARPLVASVARRASPGSPRAASRARYFHTKCTVSSTATPRATEATSTVPTSRLIPR